MNELQIFNNTEFGSIRAIEINNVPWLVGKDVAEKLGYSKPSNAVAAHVDGDDTLKQGITDSLGRIQETTLINESGLYSLILASKLPNAKKFKKWVTSEVLPSIRETGQYTGLSPELKSILILDKKTQVIENRVLTLENTMTIDYSQQAELNLLAKRRVLEALGGKDTPAYKELNKKAFSSIWKDFKRALDVNSYRNTAVKHFEAAKSFIESWEPQRDLELMIKGANSQLRIIE
jgi:prophage antirepressor-like protein